jgi:hypothetical protein
VFVRPGLGSRGGTFTDVPCRRRLVLADSFDPPIVSAEIVFELILDADHV